MASFHLWSKESLVRFAEDATARLLEHGDTIAQLKVSLNRLEVQIALAQPVPTDTLPPHANTPAVDG